MNKSKEIFQEIENKLVKDDYASTLPTYHPAKGRRKKGYKDSFKPVQEFGESTSSYQSEDPFPAPEEPVLPDPGPEIENPGKEEIDPSRDFPKRDIDNPEEEEFPQKEQHPEVDDPDEKEFYL